MYDAREITPRILVTVDFTANSERAFYRGLGWHGCTIHPWLTMLAI